MVSLCKFLMPFSCFFCPLLLLFLLLLLVLVHSYLLLFSVSFPPFMYLYLWLVSCAYFLHFSHFSILPMYIYVYIYIVCIFFKVHWLGLQRQQMSPHLSAHLYLYLFLLLSIFVCVSPMLFWPKKVLETLCFANALRVLPSDAKICIDLCLCFFFFAHISWPCECYGLIAAH